MATEQDTLTFGWAGLCHVHVHAANIRRRAEEAAAAAEIARIEVEATAVNHKFSSLAEEAAEKTKKLAKLWAKYQVRVDGGRGVYVWILLRTEMLDVFAGWCLWPCA